MTDRSLIDKINQTFIALTPTAMHYILSAWKTGEFQLPPEFGPERAAQCKCDTRNINQKVNNACTDVFHRLDADFCLFSLQVQAKKIDNICSMIHQRIHSPGTDPAMPQPHNDQGSFDEYFIDYVPEELID